MQLSFFLVQKNTMGKMTRTRFRAPSRRRSIVSLSRGKYNGRVARATATRKRSGSRTQTKKKRKINQGVHETRGGSESAFTLGSKARGLGKTIQKLAKLTYTLNSSGVYAQSAGLQSTIDDDTLFDNGDLGQIMSTTLTQQYGTSTPTGFKTERIFLHKCRAEYAYNNNTNDQVRIQIYNFVPKRDIYGTVAGGVVDATNGTTSWEAGLVHQGLASNSHQIVGSTPFASEMFCHFFTVVKVTNVTLAPGQTHYHRVTFTPNRVFTNEVLQQGNTVMFKGCTLGQMFVAYGAPCTSATGGGVTTEATKILNTTKIEYTWSYMPNNMTVSKVSNTLPLTSTGNIMDMVTGAQETFIQV